MATTAASVARNSGANSVDRNEAGASRGKTRWSSYISALGTVPLVALLAFSWLGDDGASPDAARVSPLVRTVIYVLFISVLGAPLLTHSLAQLTYVQYKFWQPFLGGPTFVLFQCIGWTLYGCALLAALVYVYFVHVLDTPAPRSRLLVAVGAAGFLSQLALIFSLGFFSSEPDESSFGVIRMTRVAGSDRGSANPLPLLGAVPPARARRVGVEVDELAIESEGIMGGNLPEWATRSWNSVLTFCLVMACVAFMLFALLELTRDSVAHSRWAPGVGIAASLLFLAAAPITHGVAGRSKHASAGSRFRFYMPFEGGAAFIFLQAFGWICYSLSLLLALWLGYLALNGLHVIQGLVFTIGTSGLVAQACLVASLFLYGSGASTRARSSLGADGAKDVTALAHKRPSVPDSDGRARALAKDLVAFCVVNLFYNLPFLEFCGLVALSVSLREHAVLLWALFFALCLRSDIAFAVFCLVAGVLHSPMLITVAVALIFYWRTYKNDPHITGVRRWPALRATEWIWNAFARYFSAAVLVDSALDPNATYVFGFHPHGIYPLTCMWASLSPDWRAKLPGVEYDPLAASIVFHLPLVRDVTMWCGARDVSRPAIEHALGSRRSVMVVPGGQAEMFLHTNERDVVYVVRKHTGFVRLAIRAGVALVPVFSFGENEILSNVHAPAMQRWTVRHLGFGFPHFPYGRMYTTLPMPTPVTVVVGAPIAVEQCDMPTEAQVAQVHAAYFSALRELFHRYKAEAGYADCQMVFDDEM